ncbi:FAD:protein FMN transferase [Microbacterium sp. NPDC091313]
MTAPTLTSPVWDFEAIGTSWRIETAHPLDAATRAEVHEAVARFDREWSRFRDDSTVSRIAAGGAVSAPADADAMLSAYVELDAATDGAVNPLVGDALARLGYDARYSLEAGDPRVTRADWRDVLTWDERMLRLSAPATIDVGALGKGRLVDRVLEIVRRRHDGDVVVDASGDLVVRGSAQRVGLEHPYDPRRAIGVVEVQDAALCASAVTRRAWGDGLHHVLDARTGVPVRAYAATWAVADTAMRADALATALFFEGGPELAAAWGAQWVRMRTDGRLEWSPGSAAELFA